MTNVILRADDIAQHRQESAVRRALLPCLHRVGVGDDRDLHEMIVADPFHGFIPGTAATLNRCRQEAYCVSRNNPGLTVLVERLDGDVVARYINGREV